MGILLFAGCSSRALDDPKDAPSDAEGGSSGTDGGASNGADFGGAGGEPGDTDEVSGARGGASAGHGAGTTGSGGTRSPTGSGGMRDTAGSGGTRNPAGSGGTRDTAGTSAGGRAGASGSSSVDCSPLVSAPPGAAVLKSCSVEFEPCLFAATTYGEQQACLAAESEACRSCDIGTLWNCATTNGCADEFGRYECCIAAECPELDEDCFMAAIEGVCEPQALAFADCILSTIETGVCPFVNPACLAEPSTGWCFGAAASDGAVSAGPVPLRYAYTREDDGGIGLVLTNTVLSVVPTGERALLVRVEAQPGQLSYPSGSGLVLCGVIQRTATGWAAVQELLCEMALDALEFASAPNTCDGHISGGLAAISGANTISVAFDAPLLVAESQLSTSCRGRDARCESDEQCCSKSCSPVLGTCN